MIITGWGFPIISKVYYPYRSTFKDSESKHCIDKVQSDLKGTMKKQTRSARIGVSKKGDACFQQPHLKHNDFN